MGKTALLVVDVQRDFYEATPPVFDAAGVLARIADVVRRARDAGLPIVYVQHGEGAGDPLQVGTRGWEIHPAVAPVPGDPVVAKSTPDSFHDTNLQSVLRDLGVESLVVVGNQTEFCVDTTCRRAFSLGYKVTLLKDAHSTWDNEHFAARGIIDHHSFILGRVFVRLDDSASIDFARLS
jgi:nicotinamidase-related amidase